MFANSKVKLTAMVSALTVHCLTDLHVSLHTYLVGCKLPKLYGCRRGIIISAFSAQLSSFGQTEVETFR